MWRIGRQTRLDIELRFDGQDLSAPNGLLLIESDWTVFVSHGPSPGPLSGSSPDLYRHLTNTMSCPSLVATEIFSLNPTLRTSAMDAALR